MKKFEEKEIFELLDPHHHGTVNSWLERGDGVAVYVNQAMDSSLGGHRQFCSYGSPSSQLETDVPPQRMPDIGPQINWAYRLEGVCRRENDTPNESP